MWAGGDWTNVGGGGRKCFRFSSCSPFESATGHHFPWPRLSLRSPGSGAAGAAGGAVPGGGGGALWRFDLLPLFGWLRFRSTLKPWDTLRLVCWHLQGGHFETIGSRCWWGFYKGSMVPGFLNGGAGFRPSTVRGFWVVI